MPSSQKAWTIDHYAVGDLKGTELSYVDLAIPELNDGEVLVKTVLLSLDASNRLWLSEDKDYLPQLQLDDVMRGLVVGRIEQSRHSNFTEGDYVFALLGWQEYAVIHGDRLTAKEGSIKFTPHKDIPLDAYVSALGLTGWSAYVGVKDIGKVQQGDTVIVTGAAGATGIMACQIAKAMGAKVIGVAGGQAKCDLLVDKVGLDGCIDYKATDDLSQAMAELLPDGMDVFFDNVGGPMLDAGLENMKAGGRLVISGSISQYDKHGDKDKLYGVKNTFMLATKRLRMEGFLILDYLDNIDAILADLEQWLVEGKIAYRNTQVDGLEKAQEVLPWLFNGKSTGKLVVKVAD